MSESPFQSLIDRFDAVEQSADYIVRELLPNASGIAISNTCVRLAWLLVKNATIAINRVPEFGEYAPLREQFLKNMKKVSHIKRFADTIEVFDEEIAGTYEDLLRGWEYARETFRKGHPLETKIAKLKYWKYGIYMPARETFTVKDRNLYQEILRIRLAIWQTKAPYWYFINFGNEGFGAYPSFRGTFFIQDTRNSIARILREEMQHAGDIIPRGSLIQIQKSYREKREVKEAFDAIYPSTGIPEGYRVMRVTKNGAIEWQNVENGQIAVWTRMQI